MRVAVSAASALCNKNSLIGFDEVVQQFAGRIIVNGSPDSDPDFEIFTGSARAVTAFAVPAALRTEYMIEPELQQRVFVRIRDKINTAAVAPITTARPAPWHELLSPEGNRTVSAVAGSHRNLRFIDKHKKGVVQRHIIGGLIMCRRITPSVFAASYSTG